MGDCGENTLTVAKRGGCCESVRAMAEADLYEPTDDFLTTKVGCWKTRVKANVRDVGEIDVLGVRYLGGDLSGQSELIAVEVKPSLARFAVSAGQAHGYSVVADRCYLAAVCDEFSPTQVLIAGRLGIGLIRIWHTPKQTRFSEILTAPPNQPVDELRLQAAERLGLAQCSLCRTLFPRSEDKPDDYKAVFRGEEPGGLRKAADKELGLVWWLVEQAQAVGRARPGENVSLRRYLCPACVWALAPTNSER